MKYDFITIGGAAEDITFVTTEGVLVDNKKDILRQELLGFEYGAKVEIDDKDVFFNFGGGAANAAVCLAKLGLKTANISTVGDDVRGVKIIKNFKKNKVDAKFVQKVKGAGTSFGFVLMNDNQKGRDRVIFFNRGAEKKMVLGKKEVKALRKTKWAYMAALSGAWMNNLEEIFSVPDLQIAWNPGNSQLTAGVNKIGKFLKKTRVLIVNKDEAISLVLTDKKYKDKPSAWLNNLKNLQTAIKAYGPQIVVITDGRNGAGVYDGAKFYTHKIIPEKKLVDTTGVGDAFGSTFVAGLEMYHGDIKQAMELGMKNAANVVSEVGAQNGLMTINN